MLCVRSGSFATLAAIRRALPPSMLIVLGRRRDAAELNPGDPWLLPPPKFCFVVCPLYP
jgi:hypothetical protein